MTYDQKPAVASAATNIPVEDIHTQATNKQSMFRWQHAFMQTSTVSLADK